MHHSSSIHHPSPIIDPSIHRSIDPSRMHHSSSIHPSIHRPTDRSIDRSIRPSIHRSIHPPTHPPIHPSIHLAIRLIWTCTTAHHGRPDERRFAHRASENAASLIVSSPIDTCTLHVYRHVCKHAYMYVAPVDHIDENALFDFQRQFRITTRSDLRLTAYVAPALSSM